MPLTSRERVLAVLNHEIPDRVPIVIGASDATSISNPTYRKLKELLGVNSPEEYLYKAQLTLTAFYPLAHQTKSVQKSSG
jgi:hypothetical protein